MDRGRYTQVSENCWRMEPVRNMRVPVIFYGSARLMDEMDAKVGEQAANVAALPGIVGAVYGMPDAHWGYGFPVGGVAAFDAAAGGVVSAGGVGFDISCGVRLLRTGLSRGDVSAVQARLADELFDRIPAGLGSTGRLRLEAAEMDDMLEGGAAWAVACGYGQRSDLDYIEERGSVAGAEPRHVSARAKTRQCEEVGTLGSGNHYLEVQHVSQIFDADAAHAFGIAEGDAVISIHCGSRGLGHQIGTEFLKEMLIAAPEYGIALPDRELACAPIDSELGRRYLGAMRAAINCALANRQVITHLVRQAFERVLPKAAIELVYDVSHNTCKEERHQLAGRKRRLHVHRKGATRAFGPGHPELPESLRAVGQPVIIGGSMGTSSYVLAGNESGETLSFASACHGAGRRMSRRQALKNWKGREVVDGLAARGILVRSPSLRGIAEEAPDAYKDVDEVVTIADGTGLARRVARLEPLVCIKG